MKGARLKDIAFVRFQAPDLDVAEKFLTDFGMVRSARTDTTLYFRGSDPAHHVEIIHLGEPKFFGFAFQVDSENDLVTLAAFPDASPIEDIDEPGGGKRVRFINPQGYQIEAVWGIQELAPLPVTPIKLNMGTARTRQGNLQRLKAGPSRVKRIGHAALMGDNPAREIAWYRERFGLVPTDEIYVPDASREIIVSFNRCERGEEFTDHHTLLCLKGPGTGLHHISFEVQDFDDVLIGHDYLRQAGYHHQWGIGRHLLGSQIFDYWQDPWGRVHEHWTDSDLISNARPPELLTMDQIGNGSQWGPDPPETFFKHHSR